MNLERLPSNQTAACPALTLPTAGTALTGLFSVSVSLYYYYFWCRCGWRASRLPCGCAFYSTLKWMGVEELPQRPHPYPGRRATGMTSYINGICGWAVVLDWTAPISIQLDSMSLWNFVVRSQRWQVRSTLGIMCSSRVHTDWSVLELRGPWGN